MKKLVLVLFLAVFLLASCGTGENNTCPNGTGFMWEETIHCINGQEYWTP